MGIQTMVSQTSGQELHLRTSLLTRQGSWYNLTLEEVRSQLGGSGKPLGSMNFDELLKNVFAAERNQGMEGMENGNGGDRGDGGGISTFPLQRQASLTLARVFSGKTVDEVWREIQQGQRRCGTEARAPSREQTLEEITLEDFLVQAGLLTDTSLSSSQGSEMIVPRMPQAGVAATSSAEKLLASSSYRRKWDDPDVSLERRLKRKIKNRESAARSRARKQAYHNELVTKVSQLEEQNMNLKKEKALCLVIFLSAIAVALPLRILKDHSSLRYSTQSSPAKRLLTQNIKFEEQVRHPFDPMHALLIISEIRPRT